MRNIWRVMPISPPPAGTNHGYTIIRLGRGPTARTTLALAKPVAAWKKVTLARLKEFAPDDGVPAQTPLDLALQWHLPPYEYKSPAQQKLPPRFKRRGDLDGQLKFIIDVLAKAWGFNDGWIDYIEVERITVPGLPKPVLGVLLSIHGALPSRQERRDAFLRLVQ
jgi:Holliday junction resolvase RusA-like endonuclease